VDRRPRSRFSDKPGGQSAKGYPSSGGVFDASHSRDFAALDLIGYSGSRGEDLCAGRPLRPTNGSRFAIKRQPWVSGVTQMVAGHPRTRSPLPRFGRLWGTFFHAIGLRSGASGPSRFRSPLDLPVCAFDSDHHLRRRFPLESMPQPPLALACDRGQVVSPRSIAALNRREPSGDDRAATPSVSDIHRGSSRVGC
jgi:hypothetical protein